MSFAGEWVRRARARHRARMEDLRAQIVAAAHAKGEVVVVVTRHPGGEDLIEVRPLPRLKPAADGYLADPRRLFIL